MMRKRRAIGRVLLIASIASNLVLLAAVLYLRVPAVHQALYPVVRVLRGSPPLATVSEVPELPRLSENQVRLTVSQDKSELVVELPQLEDEVRYRIEFDRGSPLEIAAGASLFRWSLHEGESVGETNWATVFREPPNAGAVWIGEIEVHRVSESEASQNLGTQRDDGWIYLGRCTFEVVGASSRESLLIEESIELATLTEAERARIRRAYPEVAGPWDTHATSERLVDDLRRFLALLCRLGLRTVCTTNSPAIYQTSPSEALEGVASGSVGVVCQGLRSVFVWLAISGGLLDVRDVREVDLLRTPIVDRLDPNSHAVLEVRAPGGPWFVFDALVQAAFTDESGVFLSADRIRLLRLEGRLDRIRPISLGSFCVTNVPSAYYASEVGGFWEVFRLEDTDRYNANYWSHFQRITYRNLTLPTD